MHIRKIQKKKIINQEVQENDQILVHDGFGLYPLMRPSSTFSTKYTHLQCLIVVVGRKITNI